MMKQRSRRTKRKDTEVPQPSGLTTNVADEAVNKEMDDNLVKDATTATGFEEEQDRGNIDKTQSKAIPNEPSSLGTSSGGGPRRQETMGDTIAQTSSENVSKLSNDSLLAGVNTPQSDEDRLKLQELMELCTNLQNRVINLENTKTAQAQEITSLKLRIGRSARVISSDEASLGDQEDASKQGRKINDIDKNAEITLVDETQGRHNDDIMFDVSDLASEEVFVAKQGVPDSKKDDVAQVNTADTTVSTASTILVSAALITNVKITLAQALVELKSVKLTTVASIRPKAKGLVIHEEEQATTRTVSSQQPLQVKVQDKGKGILVEEPVKSIKKKDQIRLDEELAFKLQAEEEQEERLAREKVEANVALTEEWNDIQAKNEADQLLAERLQAREQEELTIEERAILFQQLLEKRRKHFAAKRVEEKRNRPAIKTQQRSIMCTYLKNMEGWKPKDLKSKSFANIQELFDKAMKRVNTFVDYRNELMEESFKKAKVMEESSKKAKQKVEEDKESKELKQCLEIIPNDGDDVTIDATPLSTKSPTIVDYKIYKEGKKSYFQIIRADGIKVLTEKTWKLCTSCEITKDRKVIGRGIRKSVLYVMKLRKKPKDKICLTTIVENSTLWDRRLGHANMHLIQSLASKELVRNLPKLRFDQHFYDACKTRKQAHTSHKSKNIVSTSRRLELLHMDLFGPSAVRSYGGNLYTLVIVDDYSRYTWTRFLKTKTEAFKQFEIFSKKIQNQLGCSIVSIRKDHDREFANEVQLGEFCNANGITHNFSTSRTPQSNNVVERKDKTLQEMSRTMLNEQLLPKKFWCNDVNVSLCVVQIQAPFDEPVVAPKPKPFIPYPSRANKQKLHEKDDNLASKFVEIFQELHFKLSFVNTLLHMLKFALMFKSLLNNKETLFDLAKTPINENCSAVILKKLPEKHGDPGKFLISCNFLEIVECLALANLGASINLMPLSIWKKHSLPELTPTRMILELVDRSTTSPSDIAKDVFVKVGKFHFLVDFVVVDYVVDPRVPLIIGRPFLRTAHALINVYGEELTLRVDDEAITFKYAQEELGFLDSSKSGNPTPSLDPILSTSFPSLTPFERGDFILEEIKACLTNDSIPPGIDDANFDPEGDLLLLEKLLNDDSSSPLPPKELHFEELKMIKSSIDDPLEL
ncbi:reverse transcriptase domain-containing protein [Tanacetum coccineum]